MFCDMEMKKKLMVGKSFVLSIFALCVFPFTHCNDDASKSYIWYYYNIDSLYSNEVYDSGDYIFFNVGVNHYKALDTQIDSMRSLYKDNHYNQVVYDDGAEVLVNHLDSIHVISDSDFDSVHLAGTLLDDLFYVNIHGYYDLLISNYGRDRECQLNYTKKISEFEYKDGHLVSGFVIKLPNNVSPIEKEHNLTITYYFTNLKPQILKYKVVFK